MADRVQFEVLQHQCGSYLKLKLPPAPNVVVFGPRDGFLSAGASVRSRVPPRRISKLAPLQEYWSVDDSQPDVIVGSAGPCAIIVIDLTGPIHVRPGSILACESTVAFNSVGFFTTGWIEASGTGKIALYSPGPVFALADANQRSQISAARVLAYTCESASKSVGDDATLWCPAEPCTVWITTSRHNASTQRALVATSNEGTMSVRTCWGITKQIFLVAICALIFILFSDSIENFDYKTVVTSITNLFK
ncbi:Mitochondrial biogenesis AIM24 [Plasmodiophora brassicae]|uniref:Uncharacterized protein n=1 Tax=Plasmodiophora brassicae TaxID=37360 RepID=A0A0G4IT72_PLABS|nr:hypothetical protein PBRA_006662 [Plasmodiophora brassicae]SPQ95824.1 unnamed protein product [Plasmodiophora brassicae]